MTIGPTHTGTESGSEQAPRVVSRRTIHKGRRFDFEIIAVRRPGGSVIEREVVRHSGAVVVVPVTDDGRLVLIRNHRVAVGETLWECCAGTLEAGEDPAVCAGRELAEETGYSAGRIESLGWFYTTPGLTDERMHAFLATDLRFVGQDLEDDETIDVELVSTARAMEMIDRGELRDGKSLVALLIAARRGLLGLGGRGGV